MAAYNHPAYKEELKRCNYTLEYVEKSIKSMTEKKNKLDTTVEGLKKHFNSDSSQDYIDIIVNTTLQKSADLKLRNLITARSKPYFARIDFKEEGKSNLEKLYIGKMCLSREQDHELIIIDWRAPVANLYYEERLGSSSYKCPDGKVKGELLLKRQFTINEGILKEIFDIDITTSDEFLQAHLGASADNRLKEIVSTIQAEQNKIIRADMWKPLIVQGAAGSGKTTIALHRIAYLIYNYEKSFKPENFMIIAPNKLFLNYISEVLPELGVEKVKQTTFEDFALELYGKKLKIREPNEKLITFVNQNNSIEEVAKNNLLKKASTLKSSMLFKKILDDYIEMIEKSFIPPEDFKIGSKVIFSHAEIKHLFMNEYKRWPVAYRINEIKKHLNNRLKLKKDEVINQLHDDCDKKVRQLKIDIKNIEKRQQLIVKEIDKKNMILNKLESYSKKAVNEYTKRLSKKSPYQYYKELISDIALIKQLAKSKNEEETLIFMAEYTQQVLKSRYVEIEDLAPLIYLKYCIYGMDEKIPVRHIVIDEAQDFSAFQIFVLKKIIKDSSFTILGDLCQGIHSYRGVNNWREVTNQVFEDTGYELLNLVQSYRTTVEIMEAANKVIGRLKMEGITKARPVIRHGEEIKIIKNNSIKEICQDINEKIDLFKRASLKSIAIICKTKEECKTAFSYMKKSLEDMYIITGKEEKYKGGLVIVPSYLAKGLEFDAVVIFDAGKDKYKEEELDIKLLYVAITRALHKLYIYYVDEISPLLTDLM